MTALDDLKREVATVADARGAPVKLWIRDDDAVAETAELRVFLGQLSEYRAPAVLAVIPGALLPTLQPAVARHAAIRVATHGWRHANHAAADAKKSEYPVGRDRAEVASELGQGRRIIAETFGAQATGMFVPPWNRIDGAWMPTVASAGFDTVSAYADAHASDGAASVARANTHVDLMDWRGGRIGKPVDVVLSELGAAVQRYAERAPAVGILTHHLVHDMDAHLALARLLDWVANSADAELVDISAVSSQ
ncbi:MAG: polysaccharide deacetylase [Pseudomonadota bacterium]